MFGQAVVPARDKAGRIRSCLEALAGDGDLLEIVVVDDGSTDGTAEVAGLAVGPWGAQDLTGATLAS